MSDCSLRGCFVTGEHEHDANGEEVCIPLWDGSLLVLDVIAARVLYENQGKIPKERILKRGMAQDTIDLDDARQTRWRAFRMQ